MAIIQKIKKHPYFTATAVVIILGGSWWWLKGRAQAEPIRYAVASVERQALINSVTGSGQVSTLKKVDLKPLISGTVTRVNVAKGQKIKAGTVLASMDAVEASATLEQARAAYLSAEANYKKIASGTEIKDVEAAQRNVDAAETALKNAISNLETVKEQQNTSVSNTYRNLLNGGLLPVLFLAPHSTPGITEADAPIITGTYTATTTGGFFINQQGRYFSASGLENVPLQQFDTRIPMALGSSGLYVQFTTDQISATWEISIPNKKSASYASNYSSYQSSLLNQKTSITNAETQIANAERDLINAKETLDDLREPPAVEDVATAKAQMANALVQLRTAEKNYAGTKITAPFDGQIAEIAIQPGDQVGPSTVVVTLVTEKKIAEISLNEVDSAKIKTGNPVTLTFDAIENLSLTGKVSVIDVLGTVTQGVVNYTVQISMDTEDERVKPGMSVSASIITDTVPSALVVPSSAVKSSNAGSYVEIVEENNIDSGQSGGLVTLKTEPKIVVVETGKSNDTLVEIQNGINEGDVVVTQRVTSQAGSSGNSGSIRIPGFSGGGGGTTFRTGGIR